MKENPNEHYWLDEDMEGLNFTKINKDQGFYINIIMNLLYALINMKLDQILLIS